MEKQTKQQDAVIHISILNVTQYATQVNRQKLNEVMDALQKVNEDVHTLFNITDFLTQCLRYQQLYNLCLYYTSLLQRPPHMHKTSCHTHNGLHQGRYDQPTVT